MAISCNVGGCESTITAEKGTRMASGQCPDDFVREGCGKLADVLHASGLSPLAYMRKFGTFLRRGQRYRRHDTPLKPAETVGTVRGRDDKYRQPPRRRRPR